ncbi:MAG: radical SAM protein [Elusimicrobia bacterium]|nr:radical SAM protein [Elusimicrobiota bacterium]
MAELAYLQVTRLCNQTCRFCSNPENGQRIPLRRAKAWIDRFASRGYAGLILTGGEPTLHPDLAKLVGHAHRRGIAPRIITNGQRTCEPAYLRSLHDAGLGHMHVSIYSHKADVQGFLTGKEDSLACLERTLDNAHKLGIRVDINTVINHYNASHLSALVRRLITRWPKIRHFVWNNLDPMMNRAAKNTDTIARLAEFELELWRAMKLVESTGRSFRVERVPLCYMPEFERFSTETRKIVKSECRAIYFLDEKKIRIQNKRAFWSYGKSPRCQVCSLETICAGLYQMDQYYHAEELCPVFIPRERVIERIMGGAA